MERAGHFDENFVLIIVAVFSVDYAYSTELQVGRNVETGQGQLVLDQFAVRNNHKIKQETSLSA